ncbi:MAG: hypothetical protein K9H26_10815 [Prolixibacteraceae bacterium]|nr:hypothetical protein [Prolixibacteraceae bacterium]
MNKLIICPHCEAIFPASKSIKYCPNCEVKINPEECFYPTFDNLREAIIMLIRNLRRGHNTKLSKQALFLLVKENINLITQSFNLRDLVSIVDTYADHGTPTQQANALIISAFFNMCKISDTFLQFCNRREMETQPESNGVFYLYDGVNSLRLQYDDMPSVLFFRIEFSLRKHFTLFRLWREILSKLSQRSKTLQLASERNPRFFIPEFFPGRENFRGLEYPENDLVTQLIF